MIGPSIAKRLAPALTAFAAVVITGTLAYAQVGGSFNLLKGNFGLVGAALTCPLSRPISAP